ncbi:hypothetical protein VTK56DRAFT_5553 [Thermocarpiscus australiensis]
MPSLSPSSSRPPRTLHASATGTATPHQHHRRRYQQLGVRDPGVYFRDRIAEMVGIGAQPSPSSRWPSTHLLPRHQYQHPSSFLSR